MHILFSVDKSTLERSYFASLSSGFFVIFAHKEHKDIYPRACFCQFDKCQFMMIPGLFEYLEKDLWATLWAVAFSITQ